MPVKWQWRNDYDGEVGMTVKSAGMTVKLAGGTAKPAGMTVKWE